MWSLGIGAGVSDDYEFITRFVAGGYEIHLLIPRGPDAGRVAIDGVVVHTYPNFFRRTAGLPTSLKRLLWPVMFNTLVKPRAVRVARATGADFVLGHSHYTTAATRACKKRLGVPVGVKLFGVMDLVHTEWSAPKYFFKNFEQIVALKFTQDVWIILDDGTRGKDVAIERGVPADRIHFLPNGINLEWQDLGLERVAARRELGIPDDARVVLFLARLVASKRPQEVIRVIPDVASALGGDVVFVFAGDGSERAACERLARELGVESIVKFLGAVLHDDVPRVMAASDVFVTTSSLTNMAIPTCEALVCGVPVVAYDTGDTRKVVIPDETGVLVADGDRALLADALTGLLQDEAKRGKMSVAARRFAKETFTGWDERIAMEMKIIEEFI